MPTNRIESLAPQRRDSIMQAALMEFGNMPYESSSFNKIIRNAKVSKGVMYYYYESKQDLFLAVLLQCADEIKTTLQPLLTETFVTPEDFWRHSYRLLCGLFEYFLQNQQIARFAHTLNESPIRVLGSPAKTMLRDLDNWLQDLLVTGQIAGAVRQDLPLEFLTQSLRGVWCAVMAWFIRELDLAKRPVEAARCASTTFDLVTRLCRTNLCVPFEPF